MFKVNNQIIRTTSTLNMFRIFFQCFYCVSIPGFEQVNFSQIIFLMFWITSSPSPPTLKQLPLLDLTHFKSCKFQISKTEFFPKIINDFCFHKKLHLRCLTGLCMQHHNLGDFSFQLLYAKQFQCHLKANKDTFTLFGRRTSVFIFDFGPVFSNQVCFL